MKRVNVTDLLGVRYSRGEADCLAAVRSALERVFPDLEPDEVPISEEEVASAAAKGGLGARWHAIGVPVLIDYRLGDLIHTDTEGVGSGCAVVVSEAPPMAFTSLPGHGTVAVPVRRLARIVEVYRRDAR